MKFKQFILILLFFFLLNFVSAKEITFTLDQKDYYFNVGQNAIIVLEVKNTYGQVINGDLTSSFTQFVNNGGVQQSSSNSQTVAFSLEDGESKISLDFGASSIPTELLVDLKFNYFKDKDLEVSLDNFSIYFVQSEEEKKNEQNKQSSSSEEEKDPNEKSITEKLKEMFNKNQEEQQTQEQQQQSSPQQKLQNNQLSQDSSALKDQLQKESIEKQKLQEEFRQDLSDNPEFQKEHQELLNKGYELKKENLNPKGNHSGDFELDYEKQDGKTAKLSGEMENNEITNIETYESDGEEELLNKLHQNEEFQKYSKKLDQQNFSNTNTEFNNEKNNTEIKLDYENEQNKSATITAKVVDGEISSVELDRGYAKRIYFFIFLLILSCGLGYFLYNKYYRKQIEDETGNNKAKNFNYTKESKKILERSRKLFLEKEYKNAYTLVAQSLRLFLSYKNNLKKEITNDEVLQFLRDEKKDYKEIKKCFDISSLVGFAKYKANKKDFDTIFNIAQKEIH
jgi:hypothetical protein|tara:strand:+ start:6838 stop:8364 length:1527 start_codon:yes stop_codon:yes gene_type:complete